VTLPDADSLFARWARAGVLFGTRPSHRSPDPERLLLDTARLAPSHARLFALSVTWLSQYSSFVARHRLKRLVIDELEPDARPTLGLLLDLAIKHGAARGLTLVAQACGRHVEPRPLFVVHRGSAARRRLAEQAACSEAKRRGLWAPDVEPKPDALRPASWIIAHNPAYRDRAVRKGDLRCSVLEVLRLDAPHGRLDSELALVQLCAANRPAVSAALDDLEREGVRLRHRDPDDRRRHRIEYAAA